MSVTNGNEESDATKGAIYSPAYGLMPAMLSKPGTINPLDAEMNAKMPSCAARPLLSSMRSPRSFCCGSKGREGAVEMGRTQRGGCGVSIGVGVGAGDRFCDCMPGHARRIGTYVLMDMQANVPRMQV